MAKSRLLLVPDNMVVKRLQFENPWWQTGDIDADFKKYEKRHYFYLFYSLVTQTSIRRAVVLMGPRRVGKTVMMQHAISDLLKIKKVRENKICLISLENPLFQNISLQELFGRAMTTIGNEDPKGWFVFFDEIQYMNDWEVELKVMVDSYPHTKFVVSGSAAAALKLASSESGAGRFTDFMLPPLTFSEYIDMTKNKHLIVTSSINWNNKPISYYSTNNIIRLNELFVDYINFGGYPEVIFHDQIKQNMGRYIKSDIIDKVLLQDLPSLYGIKNVQELNRFFTMLVFNTGNELSLQSLSQGSGINKETIVKYLTYLEAAFLIKQIYRIDNAGKKFERQTYAKIYLTNPSLRSALFSPLNENDDAIGHMVETAVYSQSLHRDSFKYYYARWHNGEVDMVHIDPGTLKPSWALEIKWSDNASVNNSDLNSILHFCKNNKLEECIMTTKTVTDSRLVNGIYVNLLPSAVYTYNAACNSIVQKRKIL